jgi:hypothetical protein
MRAFVLSRCCRCVFTIDIRSVHKSNGRDPPDDAFVCERDMVGVKKAGSLRMFDCVPKVDLIFCHCFSVIVTLKRPRGG